MVIDTVGPEDRNANREVDRFEALRDPSHGHDFSVTEWKEMVARAGFSVKSANTVRKRLDFADWTSRMRVPASVVAQLQAILESCTGKTREYLAPETFNGQQVFDLAEMEMTATVPS